MHCIVFMQRNCCIKLLDKNKTPTERSSDVAFAFAYFPRNSTRHFATSENFDFRTGSGTL